MELTEVAVRAAKGRAMQCKLTELTGCICSTCRRVGGTGG